MGGCNVSARMAPGAARSVNALTSGPRPGLVAVALAALLATIACAGDAIGYCRTTTVRSRMFGECATTGIPLSWRTRCVGYSLFSTGIPDPIRYGDVETNAIAATGAWARVPCDLDGRAQQYLRLQPNGPTLNPTGYDPYGPNSNTVTFRHRWEDDSLHRGGTIAITVVTFDTLNGTILDADIEFNTHDAAHNGGGFEFSIASTVGDPVAVDLQTILTHEFGHFVGLAHSNNDRAVMWPEAGLGEARRDLTSDDAAGICSIYPEVNTPSAVCLPVPSGGLATQVGGSTVVGGTCSVGPLARERSARPTAGVAMALSVLALLLGRRARRFAPPGAPVSDRAAQARWSL